MVFDDLEFCQSILNNTKYLEQYLSITEIEKYFDQKQGDVFNDSEGLNFIIQKLNLSYYKCCINEYTIARKKAINKNNMIVFYNYLVYKLNVLLKFTNTDKELEKTFEIIKNSNKIQSECLLKFREVLQNEEKNINTSELYLYLLTLFIITDDMNNYLEQLLTISSSNMKNYNVCFNNEIDIEKKIQELDKIKNLILSM